MTIESLLGHYMHRRFARLMHFDLGTALAAPDPDPRHANPRVLYIHIPFCESLCPFCSFHRVLLNTAKATPYFKALRGEIRLIAARGFRPSVVYVGGGTPTVLPEELGTTLELVRSLFPVCQISVETNPNHLTESVIEGLLAVGVDRLSVGIQSFDDELLKAMGRYRSYGSGQRIGERLGYVQGRFGTLNADMIFNLPQQSERSLRRDLRILVDDIGVDQISWYPLMTSVRTGPAMRRAMGAYSLRDERSYYDLIRHGLDGRYRLSSVWCFTRKGDLIDEYIIADNDFIGAGSGSFSYLDGAMYANTFSLKGYVRLMEEKGSAVTATRVLLPGERARYDLLMALFGLRLDKEHLRRTHRERFSRLLWKELLLLKLAGLIEDRDGYLRLTRRGQYYWLVTMREFFTGVNNFREQMRQSIRAELEA